MHMANELLSVPVAAGTLAAAAGILGLICHKVRSVISSEKFALMGVLGAFIFACQMVNFQLPLMPGTSSHLIGTVLMAIILGPGLAAIVISSVVIIQCLIFQDGGLLALGCNIINMAVVPAYVGHFLYRHIAGANVSKVSRMYFAGVVSCVAAIEAGAILVPVQAALSGVLVVPLETFVFTILVVHLPIGLVEGFITVAVLEYLRQLRPGILFENSLVKNRLSGRAVLISLFILAVFAGAGLSLLASDKPDGLEWSYAERPDQPGFEPFISREDTKVETSEASAGWTSLAGVGGSAVTMGLIYAAAYLLRKRQSNS